MARGTYGIRPGDYVVDATTGAPAANLTPTGTVWADLAMTTAVTDLRATDGVTVLTALPTNAFGYFPFLGPDVAPPAKPGTLYVSFGSGAKALEPLDLMARVEALEASAASAVTSGSLSTTLADYALAADLADVASGFSDTPIVKQYDGTTWPTRPVTTRPVEWWGGTGITPPTIDPARDIWDEPNASLVDPFIAHWTAEGGTDGADIISGEATSGTPITISKGTGATAKYSTAQPFQGVKAARLVRGATSTVFAQWLATSPIGSITAATARKGLILGAGVWLDALPGAGLNDITLRLRHWNGATYDAAAYLRVTPTGGVELRNTAGSAIDGNAAAGLLAARYVTFEIKATYAASGAAVANSCRARVVPYSAALVAGTPILLGSITTAYSINTSFDSYEAGLMSPNGATGGYVDEMRAKEYDPSDAVWCF